MPKVELIETRDGSSSLFLPELNETYHSTHGALTESQYVFIEKGLKHFISQNPGRSSIHILEIGFGTGLNPWLTAIAIQDLKVEIHYTSLEKHPLDAQTVDQLNYKIDRSEKEKLIFDELHGSPWEKEIEICPNFFLEKKEADLITLLLENDSFDLVYFDAFAPSRQPEMWQPKVLNKMYEALKAKGVFITYCAQGQFKRDLKGVGFVTEELPGPPGKKEMTRGTKV